MHQIRSVALQGKISFDVSQQGLAYLMVIPCPVIVLSTRLAQPAFELLLPDLLIKRFGCSKGVLEVVVEFLGLCMVVCS